MFIPLVLGHEDVDEGLEVSLEAVVVVGAAELAGGGHQKPTRDLKVWVLRCSDVNLNFPATPTILENSGRSIPKLTTATLVLVSCSGTTERGARNPT